ncbi:MAG TPA: hypothetical protein VJ746_08815 [Nitrospira sp.]|nr:hypothetical protein [Nitrospira sp.]
MWKRRAFILKGILGASMLMQGCATHLPATPEPESVHGSVAIGRAVTVLTGDRARIYEPALRSFEIQNQATKERFTVELESDDEEFVLPLSPGQYELTRVQISEGPFLSMAQIDSTFAIGNDPITYIGTWRFGVDSPKYGRMVSVSMVTNEDDRNEVAQAARETYPSLQHGPIASVLPNPPDLQTRLFEVMPYPRVPRYFRRHWW